MLEIKIDHKLGNLEAWRTSKLVPPQALKEIGQFAASLVAERVIQKTKDAYGVKYPPYKKAKQGKRKRYFWVTPDFKQPTTGRVGYRSISSDVKTRKSDSGAVAYEDRGAYEELLGGGRSRKDKRFAMSGGMWGGLRVTLLSPTHIGINFMKSSPAYGTVSAKTTSAKNKSNAQKASFAARATGKHILELSNKEVDEIAKLIFQMSEMNAFKGLLEESKVHLIHKKANDMKKKVRAIKRTIDKLKM